jgi:hypothetical protein
MFVKFFFTLIKLCKVENVTEILTNTVRRLGLPAQLLCRLGTSVADLGRLSRIPDPKTATKERGEKKICCHTIFCSHKFPKIANYFIFKMLKKIIWANFQRIIELFTKKLSKSSQKYGFGIRDPRSGKNLFQILDPGFRGQKGTGSRIRIRNTAWNKMFLHGTKRSCLERKILACSIPSH